MPGIEDYFLMMSHYLISQFVRGYGNQDNMMWPKLNILCQLIFEDVIYYIHWKNITFLPNAARILDDPIRKKGREEGKRGNLPISWPSYIHIYKSEFKSIVLDVRVKITKYLPENTSMVILGFAIINLVRYTMSKIGFIKN